MVRTDQTDLVLPLSRTMDEQLSRDSRPLSVDILKQKR